MNLTLYPHQQEALMQTIERTRCAYYLDMGLGKTYVGAQKVWELNTFCNLVICQKSKVNDWIEHFRLYYGEDYWVFDLTKKNSFEEFWSASRHPERGKDIIGVINYDLVFRRPRLAKLEYFTLLLDESSLISNEKAQRSRFILDMQPDNVVLLSGTPVDGKYEKLWSQCRLLGWNIKKERFYDHYVIQEWRFVTQEDADGLPYTFRIPQITGYKNVDRLKRKLAECGAVFMKTDDVIDLPEQQEIMVTVPTTKEYRKFMRDRVIWVDGKQLIGDTGLTRRLYARQLCGHFNKDKLNAFRDLLDSTSDRLIVFYNFNAELDALKCICAEKMREVSCLNGHEHDLTAYENVADSVTLIQYQAGAMGVNLQKANKVIYFTLPERSELFEQSKKRIHRIGQKNTCFYYIMICDRSVEQHILETLRMRKDYTDALFEEYSS